MVQEDLTVWSQDRLQRRHDELRETVTLPHSPERALEIRRELNHVTFELTSRGGQPQAAGNSH
jgi:hypothetical protein